VWFLRGWRVEDWRSEEHLAPLVYVVDGKHVKIKVRGEDGGWYMVAEADAREGG